MQPQGVYYKYVKKVDCVRNIDVSCCRSRSRCGRGIYESTTTGGGGVLGAAPRPSHLPTFPVGGPPESVTLSIILDDNDDASDAVLHQVIFYLSGQ